MNKKLFTILISSLLLLLILLLIISSKYNLLNSSSTSARPYLIQATLTDKSPTVLTFSNIKPFVVFDKTDVIALIRNYTADDLSHLTFPPTSSDIFTINLEHNKNFEASLKLNQALWLKFFPKTGQFEKVF